MPKMARLEAPVGCRRFPLTAVGKSPPRNKKEAAMATGETGFGDVEFDLISVQYHSLKAGHDYGQYVRDAENAGMDDIASFFRAVMDEDADRAQQCHEFLKKLGETNIG